MKILKIRVENLNSLYGEHVVDLEGDLAGAPIFVVVGKTGAGKSTLTDGVSLAFFGQTPRLHDRRCKNEDDLDPRHIMSRGTAHALAQVEVRKGQDRYRATWSCRRSWSRADGNLQPPKRMLERWENGAWKVLVDDHREKFFGPSFEELLDGMTVGDFQRCVLLAQGEFAAFLEASDDERAAILERLTGTAIYQEIGRRAAARKRLSESKVREAEARAEGVTPLPSEERASLEQDATKLASEVETLGKTLHAARVALAWVQLAVRLESEWKHAREQVAAVQGRREQNTVPLARLAEHERCADAADLLVAWMEQGRAAQTLGEAIAASKTRETELEVRLEAGKARLTQATLDFESAQAAIDRQTPAIQQARSLRQHRDAARQELERAVASEKEAAARVGALEQALDRTARLAKDARLSLSLAKATWQAVAKDEGLRAELGVLEQRKHGIDELEAARADLEAEVSRIRQRVQDDAEGLSALELVLEQATESAARAKSHANQAREALEAELGDAASPGARRELLDAALQAATSRRNDVAGASQQVATVAAVEREVQKAKASLDDARATLVALGATAEQAKSGLEELEAALRTREKELDHLRWAQSVARERANLHEGEACPLCGSERHPWLAEGRHLWKDAEIAATCRELEAEIAALRQDLDATKPEVAGLHQEVSKMEGQLPLLQKALASLSDKGRLERAELDRRLAALALAPGASAALLDAVAEEADQRIEALGMQKRRLGEAERAWESAHGFCREAEAGLERSVRNIDAAKTRAASAREKLEEAVVRVAAHDAGLATKRSELLRELDKLGVGVSEPGDGRQLEQALERARERVNALTRAEQALRHAESAESSATAEEKTRKATLEEARGALVVEVARKRERHERATQLDREVCESLGGRDPDDLQRELEAARKSARVRVDQERDGQHALQAELAACVAARDKDEQRLGEVSLHRADMRARLDARLGALGLSGDDDLRGRLLGEERREEVVQLRKELDDSLAEAETVARERKAKRDEHVASRPTSLAEPVPTVAVLATECDRMDAAVTEVRARLVELRTKLRVDDETRERYERHGRQLNAAREDAALWARLHGLIGKGEGADFKRFAQSLNLAELIGKANHHLARLAPRYALVQASDGKGVPRIGFSVRDAFQAGTNRPLTTLSGGESFLVSLSLALSLADYRSTNSPIETLLLDEGFGTLDEQSLGVVMQTLEALHAGGIQVGVITHVEAMRELIHARVIVEKAGGGRSTVRVESGG